MEEGEKNQQQGYVSFIRNQKLFLKISSSLRFIPLWPDSVTSPPHNFKETGKVCLDTYQPLQRKAVKGEEIGMNCALADWWYLSYIKTTLREQWVLWEITLFISNMQLSEKSLDFEFLGIWHTTKKKTQNSLTKLFCNISRMYRIISRFTLQPIRLLIIWIFDPQRDC